MKRARFTATELLTEENNLARLCRWAKIEAVLIMNQNERTQMSYEDLVVGRVYTTGAIEVSREEAMAFATRYDPQPFHLDSAAAQQSVFGGIVASGWLTAALTMRLMVEGALGAGGGVVGLGIELLRWPLPVRPGDTLTAAVEVMAMRISESKPAWGVVKLRTVTTNQAGVMVQEMISNVLVPRKG